MSADIQIRIERALRDIEHRCDGPLTPFVLISRACRLAASGEHEPCNVADALYAALSERGWLRDDDSAMVIEWDPAS